MRPARCAVPGGDHLGADRRAVGRPARHMQADRDAAGRPELLRCRGAGHRAGRHVRGAAPAARHGWAGGAVRRGRRGAAGAFLPARHRHLVVRLGRRQAGCVRQRHAAVVGGGRPHPAGRALPGVVRQPAQVRPQCGPGQRQHASAHRARRAVRTRPAGRCLAHGGRRRPADHPAGAIRAGRRHRHHQPRRTAGGGRAAGRAAGPGGPPGEHHLQRRRRRGAGRGRVRGRPACPSPSRAARPRPSSPGCCPRPRRSVARSTPPPPSARTRSLPHWPPRPATPGWTRCWRWSCRPPPPTSSRR